MLKLKFEKNQVFKNSPVICHNFELAFKYSRNIQKAPIEQNYWKNIDF